MERNIAMIALFAALIAALAFVPALTLLNGVPISAQSMGIMLAGAILGPKRGALAVLLFLALVALGLPILSGGRGGLGVFMGPTIGYLIAFPIGAFVVGWIAGRFRNPMSITAVVTGTVISGIFLVNFIGALGMWAKLDTTFTGALMMTTPFLLGDAIKAVLTGIITAAVAQARPSLIKQRA
ncbi:biotin transporter BioY [Ketogulonicigenium robustum]|uniref:biotin transporter BioY n=1 Tax=Ketogulonicigenium robustum TaxID=92947 RepID=UPI000A270BB4|nr:biotin transporter BioY [Ketogulonicigenium robustum]